MDTLRKMKTDGASKAVLMRQIMPKLGSKAGNVDMLSGVRDQSKQPRKDGSGYTLGKMALAQRRKRDKEALKEEGTDEQA